MKLKNAIATATLIIFMPFLSEKLSASPKIQGSPTASNLKVDQLRDDLICLNFFAEIAHKQSYSPDKTSVMGPKFVKSTYPLLSEKVLEPLLERVSKTKGSPELASLKDQFSHQLQFVYKKPKDTLGGEAMCDLKLLEFGLTHPEDYDAKKVDLEKLKASSKK